MNLGIAGKVALVTGAGGGIGAAVAAALGNAGAAVAVADINGEAAGRIADEIAAQGRKTLGLAADVTSTADVETMFGEVTSALGVPTILVNNAGFTRDRRLTKMSEDDWTSVIDVVLKGAFLCTRAALPGMVEAKWGRIVSISSRAHNGNPGQGNYSAAKAGIIGFTKAMALENGRYNITANAVAPGIVDTDAVRALPHYEAIIENAKKSLAIARLGTVEDVADAVAFLASERSGYITGEILHVSGGRY